VYQNLPTVLLIVERDVFQCSAWCTWEWLWLSRLRCRHLVNLHAILIALLMKIWIQIIKLVVFRACNVTRHLNLNIILSGLAKLSKSRIARCTAEQRR
jgi:hypothetical protein